MYLREYVDTMGTGDGLVNGLQKDKTAKESARINHILRKQSIFKDQENGSNTDRTPLKKKRAPCKIH